MNMPKRDRGTRFAGTDLVLQVIAILVMFLVGAAAFLLESRRPISTAALGAVAVASTAVAVGAGWIAFGSLSAEGRRRKEDAEFMLEFGLWYLRPTSFERRGFVSALVSATAAMTALVAVMLLVAQ